VRRRSAPGAGANIAGVGIVVPGGCAVPAPPVVPVPPVMPPTPGLPALGAPTRPLAAHAASSDAPNAKVNVDVLPDIRKFTGARTNRD